MTYLSETQEDYLIDILEEIEKKTVARIKDIAKIRNVSMPTAISAIKTLLEKNIINHEKYSYVTLTDYGIEVAKELIKRKKHILHFLTFVLDIPTEIAIKDTHKLEHDLSKNSYESLTKLTEFFTLNPNIKQEFENFKKRGKQMRLSEIKVGQMAKILQIKDSSIKNKILSMGVISGAIVKVEKVALMGDPIEITLLGYHLSLRKNEAENIIVEE